MLELLSLQAEKGTFENYFGFRETPFGVTPDPRFFYSHPLYLEGLATLVYGIKAKKGLMMLTGEVGTGKTIQLMRQLETTVQFVFISSSHITSYGLVELMIQDLGVANKEKKSAGNDPRAQRLPFGAAPKGTHGGVADRRRPKPER